MWLLATKLTHDRKGIVCDDPITGTQIVLGYDAGTRTVGGAIGVFDPKSKTVIAYSEATVSTIVSDAGLKASFVPLDGFMPASFAVNDREVQDRRGAAPLSGSGLNRPPIHDISQRFTAPPSIGAGGISHRHRDPAHGSGDGEACDASPAGPLVCAQASAARIRAQLAGARLRAAPGLGHDASFLCGLAAADRRHGDERLRVDQSERRETLNINQSSVRRSSTGNRSRSAARTPSTSISPALPRRRSIASPATRPPGLPARSMRPARCCWSIRNGIAITKFGTINVGSFAASTLAIKDQDFLAGRYSFSGNGAIRACRQCRPDQCLGRRLRRAARAAASAIGR